MKYINSWKSINKQKDRVEIKIRFGILTLLEITLDYSDKKYKIMFLNIGIRN